MIRDQKVPLGPRPAHFAGYSNEHNRESSPMRSRIPSTTDRSPSAASRNESSILTFNANRSGEDVENYLGSYDFLPDVSFDDLHQSITASGSNDLDLTEFPAPGGQGSIVGDRRIIDNSDMKTTTNDDTRPAPVRKSSISRPVRGSILRRPSTSTTRKTSTSSTASSVVTPTLEPAISTATGRPRRTSQYPPISSVHSNVRAPRKSVGPGVLDSTTTTRPAQRRRPSLTTNIITTNSTDNEGTRTLEVGSTLTEGFRQSTISRTAKARSLQPPSRQPPTNLSTPEHNRFSTIGNKSPGRSSTRGPNTPGSSGKRMSVMPGLPLSASHAHGLGARTISPTDARRAQRMSMMQPMVPPVPLSPPPPHTDAATAGRAASRSPSMIPRKSATPSSSRTTPDPNRKSYSSGLSVNSNTTANTARTSTGSLQPRLPISASTSRLPTPKSRTLHGDSGNEDEEVPPVPAIPKAYESPKDSPLETPFFKQRKSSLQYDTSSLNSSSTAELSANTNVRDFAVADPEKKTQGYPSGESDMDQNGTPSSKKNIQPLRLPPLTLLPLSTPTVAKIAALPDSASNGNVTPPPRGPQSRSPTTPMTASRATFFSRHPETKTEPNLVQLRSSSSIHHTRSSSPIRDTTPAIPILQPRQSRQTVSPFISSSLPKSSGEYTYIPRSKKTADLPAAEINNDHRHHKLTGPRAAPKPIKPVATDDVPLSQSSPDEPNTPSSTSSLRRKLSLSWKRNTSKNNNAVVAGERRTEAQQMRAKHDNMPPPKLPASASVSNTNGNSRKSPSPPSKATTTNYLETKRRKSSASSLRIFGGHDRTRSESWGVNGAPKKDASRENSTDGTNRGSSRSGSGLLVSQKIGTKGSDSTLRSQNSISLESDRQDMLAEEEMKKLSGRRKETEQAARVLDALRGRASAKRRMTPEEAVRSEKLNIYERGEIIDYQDVYFCGAKGAAKRMGETTTPDGAATNSGFDDERGDYIIVKGDHLLYRFEVVDILGKGSFGQVVRCIDHKTGGLVAIKIIRNKKRFHQQAIVEVNILKNLREWDPKKKHSMVSFTDSFHFRGHLCISTELLDMNLYEFIKLNNFNGFSLNLIRRFTKQLLSSLLLLKQHKVIHCDLKPENVLLVHPAHSEIKVIDFGSSCFEHEKVYTYIQSRFYRSPEVILGMTYGMPIDMWSLGCILAELFTGYPIFPGENEQEQLACIMEVFGPPEKHLIEKSTRKKLFFDSMGKPRTVVSSKGRRRRVSSKTLQQAIKCDDEPFLDFLTRCLRWDPDRRLKPDEAIRHEFITGQKTNLQLPRGSSLAPRQDSPVRRHNTVATPATKRPLPEPPAPSLRANTAVKGRNGPSPSKPPITGTRGLSPSKSTVSITGRRQSSTSAVNGTGSVKRVSAGVASTAGGSGLPRVTRSASARQDLASAGASAAMTRRAA